MYEGDDALLTCVIRGAADNTVMWKMEDRDRHSKRVLTAGDTRVTGDRRFHILHDEGMLFSLLGRFLLSFEGSLYST